MPQIALSRRNALGVLSASAAVAVAAPAVALGEGARPVLALKNVPLSWPMYHRLKDFDLPPRVGDSLTLRREGRHPSDAKGVAVYDSAGERLGYVAQRDAAAVSWALERGSEVEARISHLETPVVKGQLVGGWGNVRIDLDVRESAAA